MIIFHIINNSISWPSSIVIRNNAFSSPSKVGKIVIVLLRD